jgi:two-component system, chemotaxis family, chemotaxis protein CheY
MKKTILVVDDFASIRDYVCDTLNRKGYHTIPASNGNEAYDMLVQKKDEIGLVLTDFNMPVCNGFELLKKIRTGESVSSTPVIFLTTESNPEKMKAAKDAGLSAWIKKPYKPETFFAQIENAMKNG